MVLRSSEEQKNLVEPTQVAEGRSSLAQGDTKDDDFDADIESKCGFWALSGAAMPLKPEELACCASSKNSLIRLRNMHPDRTSSLYHFCEKEGPMKGYNALEIAAIVTKDPDSVKALLLDGKMDPNVRNPNHGMKNVLMMALEMPRPSTLVCSDAAGRKQKKEVIRALLWQNSRGISTVTCERGCNVLHYAALYHNDEFVRKLVRELEISQGPHRGFYGAFTARMNRVSYTPADLVMMICPKCMRGERKCGVSLAMLRREEIVGLLRYGVAWYNKMVPGRAERLINMYPLTEYGLQKQCFLEGIRNEPCLRMVKLLVKYGYYHAPKTDDDNNTLNFLCGAMSALKNAPGPRYKALLDIVAFLKKSSGRQNQRKHAPFSLGE